MYFLSADEERYVQRGLLPQARRQPVTDELRGWNWPQPPLRPVYAAPLGVYEIAGKYCPTGRDVFLRRVQQIDAAPNVGMREGRLFHQLIASLFIEAKRLIYAHGTACQSPLEGLFRQPLPEPEGGRPAHVERDDLLLRLEALRAFEARRIIERVETVLAQHAHIGPDALATLALPASVEVRLSGRFIGLSEHLAADAIAFRQMLVLDAKFGPREPFHRLTTTGYALAIESLFETPVDVGCIVYVRFVGGRVLVERDFHLIDDELRQMFLEERDAKMRLVAEEIDPGLPTVCPRTCTYLGTCHPSGQNVAAVGANEALSANRRRAARPAAAASA